MEREGMINRYTCEQCGKSIYTELVDDGVTPAFLRCRFGCEAMMASSFYRVPQELPRLHTHIYEWFMPENLDGLEDGEREHVERGGLLLRRRWGVLHAWRGNCECGKWLVVVPTFTKDKTLECECGRSYYAEVGRETLTYERIEAGE
jgi:hypothetical protein